MGSRKAECVGGTISAITEQAEGLLDTTTGAQLVFTPERGKGPSLMIPYKTITGLEEIEYQDEEARKAGRGGNLAGRRPRLRAGPAWRTSPRD